MSVGQWVSEWVGQWLIVSVLEIAIASLSFASLFCCVGRTESIVPWHSPWHRAPGRIKEQQCRGSQSWQRPELRMDQEWIGHQGWKVIFGVFEIGKLSTVTGKSLLLFLPLPIVCNHSSSRSWAATQSWAESTFWSRARPHAELCLLPQLSMRHTKIKNKNPVSSHLKMHSGEKSNKCKSNLVSTPKPFRDHHPKRNIYWDVASEQNWGFFLKNICCPNAD